MSLHPLRAAAAGLLVAALAAGVSPARAQYTIKESKTEPPKELKPAVAKLLDDKAVQLLDGKGNVLCEVWFRKEVPAKATPEQVKNGLTYHEIPETTVLGAMRLDKPMTDYRKQKIKAGVYTLRLAFQPMDGDHMGTAPDPDFCLLSPAAEDKDAATMEPKALHELSAKASGGSHPAVFLLFPPQAKPEAAPKLKKEENNHWVLTRPVEVKAGDTKTTLGIVLTLIGVSSAA
jgi:hypothetical protein